MLPPGTTLQYNKFKSAVLQIHKYKNMYINSKREKTHLKVERKNFVKNVLNLLSLRKTQTVDYRL